MPVTVPPPAARPDASAALRFPEFRALLLSSAASSLASRMLAVAVGFQVYELTRSPLALGWLGLVEAVPALGLALIGGHYADRLDRRSILLVTRLVFAACAAGLAFVSWEAGPQTPVTQTLALLYGLVFVAGVARGFGDPASSAFETRIVPAPAFVNASAWLGSVGQATGIVGPALGGLLLASWSAGGTYALVAGLTLLAWAGLWRISPKPQPAPPAHERRRDSLLGGLRFVRRDPVILGSMALDLFAVLFGGVVALLPVFARDILRVGPQGLGLMLAAPAVGALLVMLWATRHPPLRNSGRTLLLGVAGFGVSIIVFALSRDFYLSLVALFFTGVFDGVNMVIRKAILRLRTPDHLRGRVAAVSLLFIGSSNELGALESGVAASLLGTARSVWAGGLVTLLVVALVAWRVPGLRSLHLGEEGPGDRPPEPQVGETVSRA
ncbi:MFS transporter [Deinococcus budaensis]|uniref:MFS family permease n=1 Tax=Deinococcus budaensis TaxID=1665626 RepID=A0A7W8GFA8_9DEIO|nr:MFS transporter [Deinococcus budaensis]MBB5234418.1 MFS family permease [Deinococcus budaensis]